RARLHGRALGGGPAHVGQLPAHLPGLAAVVHPPPRWLDPHTPAVAPPIRGHSQPHGHPPPAL
ncbi:MAG: hypothetical protein EBV07_01595, partial [Proteobacteria bacterium]|nr:hypothetical protein [Pseudomonadota bacterium]